MKRKFVVLTIVLSVVLLAIAFSGCGGSTTTATPPSTVFASLNNSGGGAGLAAQFARPSRAARMAARQTAKRAMALGAQPAAAVIDPGPINIYLWSEPAMGKDRMVSPNPASYLSAHVSLNGKTGVFSAYSNGHEQLFTVSVPAQGQNVPDPTQITTDGEDHWNPHVSPDGSKVVFIKGAASGYGEQVCVISTSGGTENCLSGLPGPAAWHASWTPDRKIAFEAWGNTNTGGTYKDEIYIVNENGTELKQITDNGNGESYDEDPSVSSDGAKMAVCRWDVSSNYGEVWVIDLLTKFRTKLTDSTKTSSDSADPLFVGPDKIVYVTEYESPNNQSTELWVMNKDGSNPAKITSNTYIDFFDVEFD